MVRIRVLRPFLWKGARQETGAEIEVPPGLAHELVSARKAEPIQPRRAPAPLDTKTAGALVPGGDKKGAGDAGK